jgi:hypothetical protein
MLVEQTVSCFFFGKLFICLFFANQNNHLLAMFCPTCYLGAGASFRESFVPLMTAFGVALLTSVIMVINILK